MPPETRYATRGETNIAYQVVGDGPVDLVLVNGLLSHMALFWSDPAASAMFRRLTSFSRLILFDKPGTGLSDPVAGPPSLEQRLEDVTVVMDAVGVERASLLGYSEGGAPACLFAATYPERCEALVLLETAAKYDWAPDFVPEARPAWDHFWETIFDAVEHWGEGRMIAAWAPSLTGAPGFWQAAGSAERICASPGMAKALLRAARVMDGRAALAQISAPTLVVNREDSIFPVQMGKHLAQEIAGAKLVVFPGKDHLVWAGAWEPIVDEIEEFLTGTRHRTDHDRALATILFTDIVSSTERAAELGDARWRALMERHDEIIGTELDRYGGRAIKTLGDGFLATFEGPAKAIRCARAICAELQPLGIELRAGVHTGECERRGDDLAGMAVNVAARIVTSARPGEVRASSTVRELVLGSGLEFVERGTHALKGVPGEWRLFAVTGDGRTDAQPVSEVDAATAALTPGPLDKLRPRDRVLLAAAQRAPGLGRALGRAALRRQRGRGGVE
ncbi:MAG: adenylate/guanylate cyclase domain-containing protein [Actinomycetota bacterium]|nr:adenylate/guanylate cyclase domain-containing protein [Actinomycetota bacterium]